jgi:hypothetical protein
MKWPLISFALMTLAGCQNQNLDPTLEGFFPEDTGETRKTTQFADVSAASGARNDAMLFKHHFDGAKLNSLGEQKLDLMLKDDDSPTPLTVYLDLTEKDAVTKQRQASVVTYLKDKGLAEAQIQILYGDNPDARSPASRGIADIGKTDTGTGPGATVGAATPGQGGGNTSPQNAGDAGSTVNTSAK